MAKVVILRARRDDQVVVPQIAAIEHDPSSIYINVLDFREEYADVWLEAHHRPNRRGNVSRRKTRHRDLIKKRLKQVVIAPVDQSHPDICPIELLGSRQTAEAPPDDDDMRLCSALYHWVQGRH